MFKEIREQLVSAGLAVRTVFRRREKRFRNMEAEVARQKGDDLRNLSRRFISALAGVRGHALPRRGGMAQEPAVTCAGRRIRVLANVGGAAQMLFRDGHMSSAP